MGAAASARNYLGRTCLHHAAAGEKRCNEGYTITENGAKRWTAVLQLLLARGVGPLIAGRNGARQPTLTRIGSRKCCDASTQVVGLLCGMSGERYLLFVRRTGRRRFWSLNILRPEGVGRSKSRFLFEM